MTNVLSPELSTVDIEWVGDPEVLDDYTKLRIELGEISQEFAQILREAEIQRTVRVRGVTKRRADPDGFPGCKGEYVWGPWDFIVPVDRRDVDAILGSPSGHQFRRVGDEEIEIIRPAGDIVLVSELELSNRATKREALEFLL